MSPVHGTIDIPYRGSFQRERSDIMSTKRRDNKNRILQNGESQRKDGRYMYKYIDNAGDTRYLYSWRLVRTDTAPQGVKDEMPLRDNVVWQIK